MSVTLNFEQPNLLIISGSGTLLRDEFEQAKLETLAYIKQHGKIAVLIVIEEDFSNLEAFTEWHDNEHDDFIQQHVQGLAIVGSEKWSEPALLFFLSGLLPFPIKYFAPAQYELAQVWLVGDMTQIDD